VLAKKNKTNSKRYAWVALKGQSMDCQLLQRQSSCVQDSSHTICPSRHHFLPPSENDVLTNDVIKTDDHRMNPERMIQNLSASAAYTTETYFSRQSTAKVTEESSRGQIAALSQAARRRNHVSKVGGDDVERKLTPRGLGAELQWNAPAQPLLKSARS